MHPIDIILQKRDGHELSTEAIHSFITAVVASEAAIPGEASITTHAPITHAQIASFLMAVFQRGLSPRELADLTAAMRFSGDTFDAAVLGPTFTVDKHSTGGVGDKTSLLLAPILAAAGLRGAALGTGSVSVPMISGRSLGHTGGTLDKLETIPGFNTQLSLGRMAEVLRECHAAMVGQTPRLVPADRILYALRDHTGTVESPFLITASIMSKKLAEDLRGLVLDVKVGSGAFMPTDEASRALAELMVATGTAAGTHTVALLTAMDEPLGRFSGNWLEVWECADLLANRRHPLSADLLELSLTLAGHMLHLAGGSPTPEAGALYADELLRDGSAEAAWLRMVAAQGGDPAVFRDPAAFHKPAAHAVFRAPRAGYLASMDCKQLGWAVQRLGAGRTRPGDPVSAHAGLESHAKLGDRVAAGQPLFTLYTDNPTLLAEPLQLLADNIHLANTPPPRLPLIRDVITAPSA